MIRVLSTIDDKKNGIFKIELIGKDDIVNSYIKDMIILDLRLAWIDEKAFNKVMENKLEEQKENIIINKNYYDCLKIENDTKAINKIAYYSKIDDDYNIVDEFALNINIELIDPYFSWNYFYFEIDPRIDGHNENINKGVIHRYKQRFAQGKGFVDLKVNGGECGLSVNNAVFNYYTRNRDCPSVEWNADSTKYQIADVCGGRSQSGNYTISGGWAYFSRFE